MAAPKPKPDVFCAQCRSREVLDLLAEKWAVLLIHALAEGPKRTAELRRKVEGISEKMLIQTLRGLERHGFVARRAYPEVPPRVEYRLTALGSSLSGLVSALDRWVEENFSRISKARLAFEKRGVRGVR
jgi:DNA-binding HxlR family transcriptional regulator